MNISQTPGYPSCLSQILFESNDILETNWAWDLPAFVHPFLLLKNKPNWFEVALSKLVQLWQYSQQSTSLDFEAKTLFTFSEPPTNIGYRQTTCSGRGPSKYFSEHLYERLKANDFIGLFKYIGLDGVSDFFSVLIIDCLAQETEHLCQRYSIPTHSVNVLQTRIKDSAWESTTFQLPYFDGRFSVLLPLDILVYFRIGKPKRYSQGELLKKQLTRKALNYSQGTARVCEINEMMSTRMENACALVGQGIPVNVAVKEQISISEFDNACRDVILSSEKNKVILKRIGQASNFILSIYPKIIKRKFGLNLDDFQLNLISSDDLVMMFFEALEIFSHEFQCQFSLAEQYRIWNIVQTTVKELEQYSFLRKSFSECA